MSRSLLLRRLRGIAGTMLTWTVGGGLAGSVVGAGISLAVLLPRSHGEHAWQVVAGLGVAGMIAGAVSGLAFALLLLLSERRRRLGDLRVPRIGLLGAAAAGGMAFLISRDPIFSAACGTFGFGAAATSLLVARRAAGPALGAGATGELLLEGD